VPHRIRLKKPWTRRGVNGETVSGVDIPDLDEHSSHPVVDGRVVDGRVVDGRVVYGRRFNRPSGIGPGDVLELEIGGVTGRLVEVRLNGSVVEFTEQPTQTSALRLEITEYAADHNELEIELESCDARATLVGAVNLWITS